MTSRIKSLHTTADSSLSHEIDWAVIEAHQGHAIEPEERHRIELAVLRGETDALVNQADWLQRMAAITQDEIATAYAQGRTYDQYIAAIQGDLVDGNEDWG